MRTNIGVFFPVCTEQRVLLTRISMNGVNIFVNELNFRFEIAVHICQHTKMKILVARAQKK